ncbi:MAG: hypothetical protein ACTHNQ_16285 [Microbacterium sp.]|uniref:hypothetical protein n=1 Tax=Microbacterium sp. TaxID=51671 RepID=UPI003F80BFB3
MAQIRPGKAITERGVVSADYILRATEGFTADLKGEHRRWLPMNSSMIVTEPLPADVWDQIGWAGRELLSDFAHGYMYAQRTADDQIAFGGRGVPYRYGSRVDQDGSTQTRAIETLTMLMQRFFPPARDVPIAHAVAGFVPGYTLKQEVQFLDQGSELDALVPSGRIDAHGYTRVTVFLEVAGAAMYLPDYAGNLDIMTSAALRAAERLVALHPPKEHTP